MLVAACRSQLSSSVAADSRSQRLS